MADFFCDRCGDFIPEGTLRYTVHVQIISDADDIMLCDGDEMPVDMRVFCKSGDVADVCDMGDDDYQELTFTLCPKCKHHFMHDPFNRGAQQLRQHRTLDRLFH